MKRLTTHTEMSLKVKKKTHRSCKALLAVWAGIQPGISPVSGRDGDRAGRPGPLLRAELSQPAACTIPEETEGSGQCPGHASLQWAGLRTANTGKALYRFKTGFSSKKLTPFRNN